MKRYSCIRCGNRKFYRVRRGKKRCRRCLYEFKERPVKETRLDKKQWKKIIEWFLLERSGLWTARQTGLGKNLVYKAFNKIRGVCLVDVPEIFSGIAWLIRLILEGRRRTKERVSYLKNP